MNFFRIVRSFLRVRSLKLSTEFRAGYETCLDLLEHGYRAQELRSMLEYTNPPADCAFAEGWRNCLNTHWRGASYNKSEAGLAVTL